MADISKVKIPGSSTTYDIKDATARSTAEDKYTKPSDGIPKTDLASAVQTSLGLADTALQSHQSLTDLGITATAAELNVLDGITATTTELNYVDGVTSNIQTQLSSQSEQIGTHTTQITSINTKLSTNAAELVTTQKVNAHTGRNLGTSYTSAQQTAVANGTFTGMAIGDYWVLGGHNWRIWDIDWYLNKGDTACSAHHLVIMPDDNLLDADGSTTRYMNDTNTTDGGYAGTKYRATYKSQCEAAINSAFGSGHILSHRELLCNAVSSGKASGWAWYDATVEMPSEVMMYGSTIWSNYTDGGSGFNVGTAYPQLALAYIDPSRVVNIESYWLRDAASATQFALVHALGYDVSSDASNAWMGVRPYFLLH